MEYLFIYLLQIAGTISGLLEIVGASAMTSLLGMLIAYFVREAIYSSRISTDAEKQCIDNIKIITKKICIFTVIAFVVLTIIPTKQTLLLIGGTHLAKQTIKSEVVNKKLEKINDIIDSQLEQYLKDLKSQAK